MNISFVCYGNQINIGNDYLDVNGYIFIDAGKQVWQFIHGRAEMWAGNSDRVWLQVVYFPDFGVLGTFHVLVELA